MSDWQVGDLALCVIGGHITGRGVPAYPRAGQCYKVAAVVLDEEYSWSGGGHELGLALADGPTNPTSPDGDWHHSRFVKVTPPAADEFDRETIALMNRAPAKEASNA